MHAFLLIIKAGDNTGTLIKRVVVTSDSKLILEYVKALVSFPSVLLVLSLIILNRYREEIRKKIASITEASGAGAKIIFTSGEKLDEVVAIAEISTLEQPFSDMLQLISSIARDFNRLAVNTQNQLAQERQNIWEPFTLLRHKQEWTDEIFRLHLELIAKYGKEAMYRALDNRMLVYMNSARSAGYGIPSTR